MNSRFRVSASVKQQDYIIRRHIRRTPLRFGIIIPTLLASRNISVTLIQALILCFRQSLNVLPSLWKLRCQIFHQSTLSAHTLYRCYFNIGNLKSFFLSFDCVSSSPLRVTLQPLELQEFTSNSKGSRTHFEVNLINILQNTGVLVNCH